MPSEPISTKDAVRALKIAANETRFRIITLLAQNGGSICVGDLAETVGMSHSATSHQLARLEDAGVVTSTRTGQTICYSLAETRIAATLACVVKQCRYMNPEA